MSNDLSYKFKKEETNRNGSVYYKKGFGRKEKPYMTPYDYGCIKSHKYAKGKLSK